MKLYKIIIIIAVIVYIISYLFNAPWHYWTATLILIIGIILFFKTPPPTNNVSFGF